MSSSVLGGLAPLIELVVPVYNEEADLPRAIERLTTALDELPWTWLITIADNASTDATPAVAQSLADAHPGVRVVTFARKGRGGALKRVWQSSTAQVLAYTDVDLSTDLNALLPLVAPLISGHSDLAIGSRLAAGARVTRGMKRELISRSYNVLLRSVLDAKFSDAQCGFKAIRADVAAELLPMVADDTWFFDTELLVIAERAGLRIHEVPVDWVDDPDSRVDVLHTALDDIRGMRRLGWSLMTRRLPVDDARIRVGRARDAGRVGVHLVLFAVVGVLSTLLYGSTYLGFRGHLGSQDANAMALTISAAFNLFLNRRFTFGQRGRSQDRTHARAAAVLVLSLIVSAGALVILSTTDPDASRIREVVVLTAANLTVTGIRFIAMRSWLFRSVSHPATPPVRVPELHL